MPLILSKRAGGAGGGSAGLPLGLAGATAATRYVGATASGAPVSGTFAVGDFIIDQTGKVYVCTVAGLPGTWVEVGGGGAFARIERSVRASDGVITFSAIPGIYNTLKVIFSGQVAAAGDLGLGMRFNGDSGANYNDDRDVAVGLSTAAGGNSGATLMYIAEVARVGNTDRVGTVEITIPEYAGTTYHKSCHSVFSDMRGDAAADRLVGNAGGVWKNAAAITSVTLLASDATDLESGSVATLYGLM